MDYGFVCRLCGVEVGIISEIEPEYREVCDTCDLLQRYSQLPDEDREAILTALSKSIIQGILEGRNRVGWSLKDLKTLAYTLDVRRVSEEISEDLTRQKLPSDRGGELTDPHRQGKECR